MKMHVYRHFVGAIVAGLVASGTIMAATPAATSPKKQAVLPTQLESDSTIAALRINLTKVDFRQFRDRVNQLIGADFPEITEQLEWLESAYTTLKGAGVNQVILAFREDIRGRDQPFIAFRTKPNTDPMRVKIALAKLGGPEPDEGDAAWSKQGPWLVVENDEVTEQSFLQSHERATNFRQALQVMRAYPIVGVFSIPPQLTAEGAKEFGNALKDGKITEDGFNLFTKGLSSRWIGGAIDPGETFKATLAIRARSAADAKKLVASIKAIRKQNPILKDDLKEVRGILQALSAIEPEANRVMVRADVDWALSQKMCAELSKSLFKARTNARSAMSMNNMKQILLGILMWADDNDGKFPDSLDQIKSYIGGSDQVLTNPITGEFPGYVYKKPANSVQALTSPSTTVILWETLEGAANPESAKGYADGHVQR